MIEDFDTKAIQQIAQQFAEAYKQAIIDSGHNASGSLVQSIKPVVLYENDTVSITLEGNEYAIYLENGTKPHFPPVSKILEWIRVKPILPRPINGKLPTEPQLAYLIARKIGRDGTDPQNTFNEANQSTKDRFINKILEAIKKDMGTELGQAFVALHKY